MTTFQNRVAFLAACVFAGISLVAVAVGPSWWISRGVIITNGTATTNDFAPTTLGQLKWIATQARHEFDTNLPSGNWSNIHAMVDGFSNSNNYVPATIGQGKWVSKPFFDQLTALGYATNYPWTSGTSDDNDFAPLLIGQLKTLFNFDLQYGMYGSSNKAMPSAFGLTSDCGDIYLDTINIAGPDAYGQLLTAGMTELSGSAAAQQGSWQGTSCDSMTNDDGHTTAPCDRPTTVLWRGPDGVHVDLTRNSLTNNDSATYTGDLDLYRAYFTNSAVLSASSGCIAYVSNNTPERVSWSVTITNGGHVHLLFQCKPTPPAMNPPFSLSLAGSGTNVPSTYMAEGMSQSFTATFTAAVPGTYAWTCSSQLSVTGKNASATITALAGPSSAVGADHVTCVFTPDGDAYSCVTSFPITVIRAGVESQAMFCASCPDCPGTIHADLAPSGVDSGSLVLTIKDTSGTVITTLDDGAVSRSGGAYEYTWNGTNSVGMMVTTGQYKVHAEWTVNGASSTNEQAFIVGGVWFETNSIVLAWTNNVDGADLMTFDASAWLSGRTYPATGLTWYVSYPPDKFAFVDSTGAVTCVYPGKYIVTATNGGHCSAVLTVAVVRIAFTNDPYCGDASQRDPVPMRLTDDSDTNVVWTLSPAGGSGAALLKSSGPAVSASCGSLMNIYTVRVESVLSTSVWAETTLTIRNNVDYDCPTCYTFSRGGIHAASGNASIEEPDDISVPLPGIALTFQRTYNSRLNDSPNGMGRGWTHNYDWQLKDFVNTSHRGVSGAEWRVLYAAGSEQQWFLKQADGSYASPFDNNLLMFTNSSGTTVQLPGNNIYQFDTSNRLASIDAPGGNYLSLSYDTWRDQPRLASVTHSSNGRKLNFTYTTNGLLEKVADSGSANLWVEYGRNPNSSITSAVRHVDASAYSSSYSYDGDNTLTTHVRPGGTAAVYSYVPDFTNAGRVVKRATGMSLGGASNYYQHAVNKTGAGSSTIAYNRDGISLTNRYAYDPASRLIQSVTSPGGTAVTYGHDTNANPISEHTISGSVESWVTRQYDARHNPTNVTFAYNGGPTSVMQYTWDTNLQVMTSSLDQDGVRAVYGWSTNGLLESVGISGGSFFQRTGMGYVNGQVSAVTNAKGHATSFGYDINGYLSSVTPPAGPAVSFTRDAYGNATSIQLPGGRTTMYDVASDGRVSGVTYADGLSSSFQYDPLGLLTNAVDRAGRTNRFEYLPTGVLLASYIQNGDGGWITNSAGFDQQMNVRRITDAMGRNVETYTLDADDRVVAVTNLEGQSAGISYALGGFVSKVTRYDGSIVTNAYTAGGQLSSVQYLPASGSGQAGETNMFTYSAAGRMLAASGVSGVVTNSLDGLGRLTNQQQQLAAFTNSVGWSYDAAGNVTNAATGDGSIALTYGYDAAERISFLRNGSSEFQFSYNTNNGLVASVAVTNADGITASYGYDVMDRLTNLSWTATNGTVLRKFGYQFNAVGLITNRVDETNGVTAYAYDALDRLSSVANASSTNVFQYDLAGNRTNSIVNGIGTPWYYGAANQLTNFGANTFVQYDAAGNVTSIQYSANRKLDLTWNARYELVSVSSNGTMLERYDYDALGRRVRIMSAEVTNVLAYDGLQIVAEYTNGALARTYTWGPGIDNLLSMKSGTNVYYAMKDHLGSVIAFANSAGGIVESYSYDAWGVVTIINAGGTNIASSAIGNRYLFQGREYSQLTGLYNFRARYYDPVTARWLSKDPIGISGGKNLYMFCGNSPVNSTDPSGLVWGRWGSGEEVGFGESFIPVWGSGRQAVNDFSDGRYIWGSLNTAMAISDAIPGASVAKAAAKAGGKKGLKMLWKCGSTKYGAFNKWYRKWAEVAKGDEVHHWLIPYEMYKDTWAEKLFNQPWNAMVVSERVHDVLHESGLEKLPQKLWKGTPDWFKAMFSSGAMRDGETMLREDDSSASE